MENERRRAAARGKFFGTRPSAVQLSAESLVRTSLLKEGGPLPLVVEVRLLGAVDLVLGCFVEPVRRVGDGDVLLGGHALQLDRTIDLSRLLHVLSHAAAGTRAPAAHASSGCCRRRLRLALLQVVGRVAEDQDDHQEDDQDQRDPGQDLDMPFGAASPRLPAP